MAKTRKKKLKNNKSTVFVDVDGTLIKWKNQNNAKINEKLVFRIKEAKSEGVEFVLWSRRGAIYAERVADHYSIKNLFVAIVAKPTAIIDDEGLNWLKGVRLNPGVTHDQLGGVVGWFEDQD